ncbi:MAG: AAA family ATPase [Gammaproteobacteria bacterium]|nr:AAA family ATPase [Gammaproteobacteria bacterium]
MNQKMEKEDSGATITELVAKAGHTGSQFFKPVDDKSEAPTVIRDAGSQPPQKDSGNVYIEELLRKNNMLVQGSNLGPVFADEYRRIKRPLLSNAFGRSASLLEKGNLILVTSTISGEGKTHTAINLALSIAHERDNTVLLVDCDVSRHGASRALGIADRPGLVDMLENEKFSVGDAILRTDIPELCLISAGKQHDFVTELLASKRMSELVTEIGERYDDRIIIFDGPPLLPTPQTQVLTTLVGQVVFVIEAGKTPQALVDEALDMISEDQATGLVMNKSEGISGRGSYYYGYYGEK